MMESRNLFEQGHALRRLTHLSLAMSDVAEIADVHTFSPARSSSLLFLVSVVCSCFLTLVLFFPPNSIPPLSTSAAYKSAYKTEKI